MNSPRYRKGYSRLRIFSNAAPENYGRKVKNMASSLMHYAITDKILQLFPMHDGARLRFGAVTAGRFRKQAENTFFAFTMKSSAFGFMILNRTARSFGERMQKR